MDFSNPLFQQLFQRAQAGAGQQGQPGAMGQAFGSMSGGLGSLFRRGGGIAGMFGRDQGQMAGQAQGQPGISNPLPPGGGAGFQPPWMSQGGGMMYPGGSKDFNEAGGGYQSPKLLPGFQGKPFPPSMGSPIGNIGGMSNNTGITGGGSPPWASSFRAPDQNAKLASTNPQQQAQLDQEQKNPQGQGQFANLPKMDMGNIRY